jgi:RHS repeat-associated protein
VQATLPVGYTFNNFNFTYDQVGNLTQLQNTAQPPLSFTAGGLGNAIGGPWQMCYAYDDLYRLISSNGSFGSTVTSCTDATAGSSYTFSQSYDSIHNITHKTQTAMQNTAVNPQITYNNAYTYPAPGSAHPHSPTAIGEFNLTTDADGNQITTQDTGTGSVSQYLFDEENRLSCTNKGPQMPSPSCTGSNLIDFIYDHAGVRKIKSAATPTIYPNQFYTDFGGGSGNQFKHIFIGSERILTKKTRIAPDREHWYYHPDHLGSTAMVTNEKSQLVDALHYFPFGEVWLEERPSSLPADYFFTAKEFDPETGFYNFGARYLDPRFSKWMTADPALGSYLPGAGAAVAYQSPALANAWRGHPDLPGLGGTFTPSNLALYGYGHQNPATLGDPNGRMAQAAPLAACVGGPIACGGGIVVAGVLVLATVAAGTIAWMSSKNDDPVPPSRAPRFLGDNRGPVEPPGPPNPDPKVTATVNAVAATVVAIRYGTLSGDLPEGYQANHLNQDAAYRDVIPHNEGLSNKLRGNAFTEPGSPHYDFHQSLNQFWRPYQRGGELFGKVPTNAEYGQALEEALRTSGLSSTEVSQLSALARAQRLRYGLSETSPVPRVPRAPQ